MDIPGRVADEVGRGKLRPGPVRAEARVAQALTAHTLAPHHPGGCYLSTTTRVLDDSPAWVARTM